MVDSRWAITNVVRPRRSARSPSWISASLSLSRLDVASSRIRMRGSARMARAIATRCRWPPESFTPAPPRSCRSPLEPSMNSSQCAMRAALAISASAARVGREKAMFSRSCRRRGSCPAAPRPAGCGTPAAGVLRSMPSTSTRPASGRLKAMTRLMSVLLPDPLDPTSAVVVPGAAPERDVAQHRHVRHVLEVHALERDLAAQPGEGSPRPVVRHPRWQRRSSRIRSSPAKPR
jgi:hypothetical protein